MELAQQINRLGCFTASSIFNLMKSGKKKDEMFGGMALTYIHEKIAEIITCESKPQAKGVALEWGNEHEKDAAMWLQNYKYVQFEYMGKENFKYFPYNKWSGGSPDGLNEQSVIELKCPYNSSNHIQWLIAEHNNEHEKWLIENHFDYYIQVQFNMMCTKRNNAIIASYDPRTKDEKHRMAVLQIARDEFTQSELDTRINAATDIVINAVKLLQ